jgi:hypothetical protein
MNQTAPLAVVTNVGLGTSAASADCCSSTDASYISNRRGSSSNPNPFSILLDSFDYDRYELIKPDDRNQ